VRTIKVVILLVIVIGAGNGWAQRRGALQMGGSFYFQSGSTSNEESNSQLNLNWLIDSYFSHNYAFELEPSVQISFVGDSINVGSLILAGLSKRLANLSPPTPRDAQYRKYELGTSATVFGTLGAGLWVAGTSVTTRPAANYSGPALYAGVASQTFLGNLTSLRVSLKYVYLFPSGEVYTKARRLWQIGLGFAIFVHT